MAEINSQSLAAYVSQKFENTKCTEKLAGLQKVPLLKALENLSQEWFTEKFISGKPVSPEAREKLVRCSCQSNFSGVEDFSQEYFDMLALAERRQECTRLLCEIAMEKLDHGFCELDQILILGSTAVSRAYGPYYQAWARMVSDKNVAEYIDKNGKPEAGSDYYNSYTALTMQDGELQSVPFMNHFKEEITGILAAFDMFCKRLETVEDNKGFLPFLKQYMACLAATDNSNLEKMNMELDRLWMDVDYWIDILHDIETGYGDPLRCKAIPDFSLRFKDSTYQANNEKMSEIKRLMMAYFRGRNTEIAKNGLKGLGKTSAAIYYIPFQCGMSLHFRFSGQCIPNREEVKEEKGIKIYFDPVSKKDRMKQVRALAEAVFDEASMNEIKRLNALDGVQDLTYMTSAHEVGHAIYNLRRVPNLSPDITCLLEEPRAELTSIFTLKLLRDVNMINDEQMQSIFLCFAFSDLRRFEQWEAKSTYAYTISAINMYKTHFRNGVVSFSDEGKTKLKLDTSKIYDTITDLSNLFENMLSLEDQQDVKGLENMQAMMKNPENELIQWLVEKLYKK